ncbi:MAG: AHH domain-containing protein [Desulfatitalea sp.]|nr:AHH domain-containing protein [Desulfatitalea sp.]NNJ99389.1 AHH domain-containing protein [Desulfatitalea sp.]
MAGENHIKKLREDEYHLKGKNNGCVFRCSKSGHKHRENGYDYAKSNFASMYNKDFSSGTNRAMADTHLGPNVYINNHRDPRSANNIWHIGAGKYSHLNYKKGFWPFINQAHHILPCTSLKNEFGISELKWLMKCKYNINAGLNIIILPTEIKPALLMNMLRHPGGHARYNTAVKEIVKKIRGQFGRGEDDEVDGHEPIDQENMPNIQKDLEAWSKDQMAELFIAGYDSPGETVNTARVSGFDT